MTPSPPKETKCVYCGKILKDIKEAINHLKTHRKGKVL